MAAAARQKQILVQRLLVHVKCNMAVQVDGVLAVEIRYWIGTFMSKFGTNVWLPCVQEFQNRPNEAPTGNDKNVINQSAIT